MTEELSSTKKFWMTLAVIFVAIFLSCFAAFYVLALQMNKNSEQDYFFGDNFGNMNMHKYMMQTDRMFDDFDKEFANIPDAELFPMGMLRFGSSKILNDAPTVKTDETPQEYKISVKLKPFNNDAKNVEVKTKGKRVSISAEYKNEKDKSYNSSMFYESFVLPSKIDSSMIKKEVKGEYLTITIPKKPTK